LAAGNANLVEVSADGSRWFAVHLTHTVEAETAARQPVHEPMELIARRTRSALELRGRKAPNMQMVLVQSGNRPATREFDGDLDLIAGHRPTADGAGSTDPVWNRSPRRRRPMSTARRLRGFIRPNLAVLAILHTLELPGREAAHVDVKLVQPRLNAVKRELDLELQLVLRNRLNAVKRELDRTPTGSS
jgi:hypothetical protein